MDQSIKLPGVLSPKVFGWTCYLSVSQINGGTADPSPVTLTDSLESQRMAAQ